jgi:hypothetical protein
MIALTRKELINKAMDGIIAQGVRSVDNTSGFCVYRDAHGRKCAAGHLIDDKVFHDCSMAKPGINMTGALDPDVRTMLILSGVDLAADSAVVSILQYVHDAERPDTWPAIKTVLLDNINGLDYMSYPEIREKASKIW